MKHTTPAHGPRASRIATLAALLALIFVAGCNSPMPPDNSNGDGTFGAKGTGEVPAVGTREAIQTLALPPAKPLTPNPEYAGFPRYVGTLGSAQIELRLGAKTDEPSGVHGEYRLAGSRSVVLVAGDRDGDTLEIEESNDGTHITGNWVGKFAADGSVSGERMNVDDSDPQPFELRPAGASNGAKAVVPAAPSLEPAPPPKPRNAVGGTSNVIIGE